MNISNKWTNEWANEKEIDKWINDITEDMLIKKKKNK